MRLVVAGSLSALVFVGSMVGACSKSTPEPTPTAASASVSSGIAPASAAASGMASAPTPDLPLSATPSAYLSIPDRFNAEASGRPANVPRPEDLFAAFKKDDIKIHDVAQHMAAPFGAKFCVGFQGGKDLHGSFCEYKDEAAAKTGGEASDKAFKTNTRKVQRNGAATLTVRIGTASPEDEALGKKWVDLFNALKPTKEAPKGRMPGPFDNSTPAPASPSEPAPAQ